MSQQRQIGVLGVGVYLPPEIRKNDWWPEHVVDSWRADAARSVVRPQRDADVPVTPGVQAVLEGMAEVREDPFRGAVERRVMPEGMWTSQMETEAAHEALARSGVDPRDIGVLLTHSQVPDYQTLPNAPILHERLGLPEHCLSLGTDSACNSFLTQVALAAQLLRGGQVQYALLVQSCGFLHMCRPEDPYSAWFGDAATAVVMGPVGEGHGVLGQSHHTDGSLFGALVAGTPGGRWYQGQTTVYVDNPAAARKMLLTVADSGKVVVDEALAQAGATPEQVGFYGSHQASAWFRKVTQRHCGLVNARWIDSFPWAGSVSACNIPLALAMGEREGLLRDGDLVATYSGGSGITFSSVVLRWGK